MMDKGSVYIHTHTHTHTSIHAYIYCVQVWQRKTNTVWHHLYVESKKSLTLREIDGWLPEDGRWEKQGDVGQRVQTSSFKINKFWASNVQNSNYI